MKKRVFYTEIAFFLGLAFLSLGTSLTVYGDFGISMVVAPAYILHLYISKFLPFFTFGVAEYVVQAFVLLILILIIRKAKFSYLLSFGATVFYGLCLDCAMRLTSLIPVDIYLRNILYLIGVFVCCASIALMVSSYLPPEAYELFSKEISHKYNTKFHKIVNFYNYGSLFVSIILSFVFFGNIQGIGSGTVVCAIIYGFIIKWFQRLYNKCFDFKDKFDLRKKFE